MKKIMLSMALFAMVFVACEKEATSPLTDITDSDVQEYSSKIKSSKNKSVSYFTKEEAELHISDVLSSGNLVGLKLKVINSDSGTNPIEYQITSIPFEGENVNSPSDPESVWLFPDQFNQAMDEAFTMALAVYPCEVRIDAGYGLIAVNAYC